MVKSGRLSHGFQISGQCPSSPSSPYRFHPNPAWQPKLTATHHSPKHGPIWPTGFSFIFSRDQQGNNMKGGYQWVCLWSLSQHIMPSQEVP